MLQKASKEATKQATSQLKAHRQAAGSHLVMPGRSFFSPFSASVPTGIPPIVQRRIENASGVSLEDVKVHYHSSLPAQVQALAYTQGNEVFLGPGQEMHLAHELGHVVQQKRGSVPVTALVNHVPLNDDPALEREADQIGAGKPSTFASAFPHAPVQRKVIQRLIHYTIIDYLYAHKKDQNLQRFLPRGKGLGNPRQLVAYLRGVFPGASFNGGLPFDELTDGGKLLGLLRKFNNYRSHPPIVDADRPPLPPITKNYIYRWVSDAEKRQIESKGGLIRKGDASTNAVWIAAQSWDKTQVRNEYCARFEVDIASWLRSHQGDLLNFSEGTQGEAERPDVILVKPTTEEFCFGIGSLLIDGLNPFINQRTIKILPRAQVDRRF